MHSEPAFLFLSVQAILLTSDLDKAKRVPILINFKKMLIKQWLAGFGLKYKAVQAGIFNKLCYWGWREKTEKPDQCNRVLPVYP